MKTLNADLKAGQFKPVYLLCGEDAFLKRSYKLRFLESFGGSGSMNVMVLEGKDISEDQVIDTAETLPFFADRRLIVIENSGWMKGGAEKLPDYLPKMAETSTILFVEDAVDKRSRLYKAAQKCGYVAELSHPEEKELSLWAARYLARAGKKVTQSTMDHFLDYVGDDMESVKNELEKLIAYLGERDVVTRQDVDSITSRTVTGRIFDLVSAITGRRTKEAMELYEDLLTTREPPMRILFLIARQYRQMLAAKELLTAGQKQPEIAKQLKIPGFAAGRLMREVRSLSQHQLLAKVKLCAELDYAVKSGNLPDRLAADMLICG